MAHHFRHSSRWNLADARTIRTSPIHDEIRSKRWSHSNCFIARRAQRFRFVKNYCEPSVRQCKRKSRRSVGRDWSFARCRISPLFLSLSQSFEVGERSVSSRRIVFVMHRWLAARLPIQGPRVLAVVAVRT